MPNATIAPYAKRQLLQYLIAFYVFAALMTITLLIDGTTQALYPYAEYGAILGTAIVLPALLWIDHKVRHIRAAFFCAMYATAGCIVIGYLGAYSPLSTVWIILCIITYQQFGTKGFVLSSFFLVLVTLLFCAVVPVGYVFEENIPSYVFYSLIFCAVQILTAYVFKRILDGSEHARYELQQTRELELIEFNKVNVLLNTINEAILTLDTSMRVSAQNAAALSFFDTNDSLIGKDISELLHVVDGQSQAVDMKSLVDGVLRSITREDLVIPSEDHGDMRISLQITPIYIANQGNERQGVVVVIRDITKQKTLEDEKDEFISVTSHELRTPIAIVEGSLGSLAALQEHGADPSKLKQMMKMATDQIKYLSNIVNDITTITMSEDDTNELLEQIDVKELLHAMYLRYEPEAAQKGLRLELDIQGTLPPIQASRLYTEEIFQNLITNAIKYTSTGSVTISAGMTDEGLTCAVKDTGIGISTTDLKKIFQRFYRSEDYRTRETGGTGLGLYIVEKLARKLHAKISVDSRLNHGSTFTLVIPVVAQH